MDSDFVFDILLESDLKISQATFEDSVKQLTVKQLAQNLLFFHLPYQMYASFLSFFISWQFVKN